MASGECEHKETLGQGNCLFRPPGIVLVRGEKVMEEKGGELLKAGIGLRASPDNPTVIEEGR